jgi:integrase
MTRPTKHPTTGVYRIRKVVPKDIRPIIGTTERIVSLGTKDPAEAMRRAPAALAKIEREFTAARAALGPERRLTHREVVALCGALYRETVEHWEDDPGTPEGWELFASHLHDALERDDATGEVVGPNAPDFEDAETLARQHGITPDADSVRRIAVALYGTRMKAADTLRRRAEGDYSPDTHAPTFPPIATPATTVAKPPGLSAKGEPLSGPKLLELWAAEVRPAPATVDKYAATFRSLARILGFDDVRRITADDVVRFKEARSAEKRSAKTIADDVLSAGAVLRWAVKNRKVTDNPFAGMAPKVKRRGEAPRDPYSDDDAKRILIAARHETGALRWLPWLLCFTGARLGELAELRRCDVRQDSGVTILDIRPTEARAGKNETMQRMIPLHPALIAEGFLRYVAALPADPAGPLFPSLVPSKDGTRTTNAQAAHGRWMREVVGIKDPRKAPAHSWRHRMEDALRIARVSQEAQDAITGRHNPRNAGAGYGKGFRGMPDEVLKDLERVPSPVPPPARNSASE